MANAYEKAETAVFSRACAKSICFDSRSANKTNNNMITKEVVA